MRVRIELVQAIAMAVGVAEMVLVSVTQATAVRLVSRTAPMSAHTKVIASRALAFVLLVFLVWIAPKGVVAMGMGLVKHQGSASAMRVGQATIALFGSCVQTPAAQVMALVRMALAFAHTGSRVYRVQ